MGNGIAQAFAQAGFEVVMSDVAQAALDRAMNTISGSLRPPHQEGEDDGRAEGRGAGAHPDRHRARRAEGLRTW
jgi:3-hydroxyacyl-CoA dehydrogenase